MVFAVSRRLDASICKSLGPPFSIDAAYAIMGLVAPLAFPALLDLSLSGGGSDVDLLTSCRGLPLYHSQSPLPCSFSGFRRKMIIWGCFCVATF